VLDAVVVGAAAAKLVVRSKSIGVVVWLTKRKLEIHIHLSVLWKSVINGVYDR